MRFSLIVMSVILMVTPPCWRCWIGGVWARDTESVMDTSLNINRGPRESVCLDRYKSEPFLRYARCLRSFRSVRALYLNASSAVTKAENSYFLIGFALLYPLSMILVGVMSFAK